MTFNSNFFPGCDPCSPEKREIIFHVKLTVLVILPANADSTVAAIILRKLYKYTFRMIFIVFHGKEQIHAHAGKGITHHLPLIVLLVLSTFVGAMIVPPLQGVLPDTTELEHGRVLTLEIASGIIAIAGILIAAWLWLGKRTLVTSIANSAPGRLLGTWWYNAWGFDWLYDMIFVKPFLGIAWLLKRDPLNSLMNIPAILSRFAGKGLLVSENGYLRWYVASMSIGAVVVLALLMVLR